MASSETSTISVATDNVLFSLDFFEKSFFKSSYRTRFIFLVLSVAALASDVHSRMMTKKCVSSVDCGEDYICGEGVCHDCLDCGLLFREGPSCVMDFKQCGSCLKGYKDFLVTDFSTVIKPCEKIERRGDSLECLDDHHCPIDNYCHENSCVKCFDCSLYNRLPPTRNCAKEPQDCSSCLNGFHEVPVTTEKNTKPCQKIVPHSTQNVSLTQYFGSSSNVTLILLGSFEVLVIVALVIMIYKRQTGKSKRFVAIQGHSERPPPYPSDGCQYVREPEPEVEEESSFCTFVQEEKQQANTAIVFRLPQASYYYDDEDDIANLIENSLGDEEGVDLNTVDSGLQHQSDVHSFSNTTETDLGMACSQIVDDFEVVSEAEMNMTSGANVSDSTSTEVNNGVEECTVEESKNPNEGGEKGLEQKEENDLTE